MKISLSRRMQGRELQRHTGMDSMLSAREENGKAFVSTLNAVSIHGRAHRAPRQPKIILLLVGVTKARLIVTKRSTKRIAELHQPQGNPRSEPRAPDLGLQACRDAASNNPTVLELFMVGCSLHSCTPALLHFIVLFPSCSALGVIAPISASPHSQLQDTNQQLRGWKSAAETPFSVRLGSHMAKRLASAEHHPTLHHVAG